MKHVDVQPLVFSAVQAMAMLGVDRARFYKYIAEGRLKTFKHGRRRFVSADALHECVRSLEESS